MITENLSTLEIHKLTQEQYDKALAEGRINEKAIYLTPDDASSSGDLITVEDIDSICGATLDEGVSLTFNNYSVSDDGSGNITISEGA